ncbi:hypothetical protein ACFQ4K_31335 [Tistrella bauzanensis]
MIRSCLLSTMNDARSPIAPSNAQPSNAQWLNIHGRFDGKVFIAGLSAVAVKPFADPP